MMFEKANQLLRHEDLIVKKLGADDRSYIVAGHTNQIYCDAPAKEGSFQYDRNCVNASTKICEHTIEKYGKLPDFITWYKRSKSGASITKMALSGAPKAAGRKPSTTKRSNRKRPSPTLLLDLLENCNNQLEQIWNESYVPPMQISTAYPIVIPSSLIISFQIMLCINHLSFNKIISSHRYKETVSFLNG